MGKLFVHWILRKERLPTHTVIQSNAWSDFPGILRIHAGVQLVDIKRVRSVLEKDAGASQKEIRQAQPGHLTIECKWSGGTIVNCALLAPLGQVYTQRKLMISTDPA